MDFPTVTKFAGLLSRSYAEDFLRLLLRYRDISASEAASRLDQHIKTAQDFLEGLAALDIVEKKEVSEGKRPYFRYCLKKTRLTLDLDLAVLHDPARDEALLKRRIRERKNSGAVFSAGGSNPWISSVVHFSGDGRSKKEHRITLTRAQGLFLYHLPFPGTDYLAVREIIAASGIKAESIPEALDLVEMLEKAGVVEYE
ncbi:hypothetical protein JXO52_02845 [bacterium]|nr:hypothetical protein [bacterium]